MPRDKPMIVWIASFTEVEYDIYKLKQSTNKMDLRICSLYPDQGANIEFPEFIMDTPRLEASRPQDSFDEASLTQPRLELLKRIANENPDLVILKYMGNLVSTTWDYSKQIKEIFKDIPHTIWCSEQGAMRRFQEYVARRFDWVTANNRVDVEYYKSIGVPKVSYMPFGCVPSFQERVEPNISYLTDCLADGVPHYFSEDSKDKRESVDIMVRPIANKKWKLSIWGQGQGLCGWLSINGLAPYYKGVYPYKVVPTIYSSAKIYLGITFNWRIGGYGKKLATALGCGLFTIWHKTVGIESDFEKGKHLEWSSTSQETIDLVEYYMENEKEREKIALEGQKYAYNNLNYETNILKLLKEVG